MPKLICKFCKQEFYSKHSTAKYCCKEHSYHAPKLNKKEIRKKMLVDSALPAVRKSIKSSPFYGKEEVFQDKIIDYPSSPTGKAYVGLAKKPLMPNKNGIGFQGVLLQDHTRTYVQCFSCGKWAKTIGKKHIVKCTGKTMDKYKEKYGLLRGTTLVSDASSLALTKAALKNKAINNQNFAKLNKFNFKKIHKKATAASMKFTRKRPDIREWQNRHGTCPEQIKARLKQFILQNRELPTSHNKGYALYKALRRKFGSLSLALQFHGLPKMEKYGTSYIYTFPNKDIVKFNINKFDQREQLFEKMIMECDLFTDADRQFYLNNI